jgi:hypothetical protein
MVTRKLHYLFVAAIAAALALTVNPASADPDPAVVIKDFSCFIFIPPVSATTTDQTIEVDSASGNTTLSCHFRADDFTGPLPTETLHFEGFTCGTFAGSTTDSFAVFNKNGNGLLRCQITA